MPSKRRTGITERMIEEEARDTESSSDGKGIFDKKNGTE